MKKHALPTEHDFLQKIKNFVNIQTGKRYWYQIKFTYKNKKGEKIFDFYEPVGFLEQRSILKNGCRDAKTMFNAYYRIPPQKRYVLCNGVLIATPVSFLGHFRKK
jgi:hypothetical protein